MKKPGWKLVIFARERELSKDHYDVAASFKLPNEKWNDMYQSALGSAPIAEFPTCEVASCLQTTQF
jgi:hypothetical protein